MRRKKFVKKFIISLLIVQGIYVIFPLPDVWPVSNYSMFSRAPASPSASATVIYGVSGNGVESEFNSKDISPFDFPKLRKGISRIINAERFERKNEKRINRIADAFNFFPFNKIPLKQFINEKLIYARAEQNIEKQLESVCDYLLAQYKRNGGSEVFSEVRIYRKSWNWTGAGAQVERTLIYSSTAGIKSQ